MYLVRQVNAINSRGKKVFQDFSIPCIFLPSLKGGALNFVNL